CPAARSARRRPPRGLSRERPPALSSLPRTFHAVLPPSPGGCPPPLSHEPGLLASGGSEFRASNTGYPGPARGVNARLLIRAGVDIPLSERVSSPPTSTRSILC